MSDKAFKTAKEAIDFLSEPAFPKELFEAIDAILERSSRGSLVDVIYRYNRKLGHERNEVSVTIPFRHGTITLTEECLRSLQRRILANELTESDFRILDGIISLICNADRDPLRTSTLANAIANAKLGDTIYIGVGSGVLPVQVEVCEAPKKEETWRDRKPLL